MTVLELPFNKPDLHVLQIKDFTDDIYVKRFIMPTAIGREFYVYNGQLTMLPVYDFLGDNFDLGAKVGDTCRLGVKAYLDKPKNPPFDHVGSWMIHYLWNGIISNELYRESSVRIGAAYIRAVLIEKHKKTPIKDRGLSLV